MMKKPSHLDKPWTLNLQEHTLCFLILRNSTSRPSLDYMKLLLEHQNNFQMHCGQKCHNNSNKFLNSPFHQSVVCDAYTCIFSQMITDKYKMSFFSAYEIRYINSEPYLVWGDNKNLRQCPCHSLA